MNATMHVCPACKGNKKKVAYVTEQRHERKLEMTCLACKGAGEVTDAQLKAIAAFQDSWCRCDNPDFEQAIFYDNGRHPDCRKHHWRCGDCGKILQVG